jgi:hypothetical protein
MINYINKDIITAFKEGEIKCLAHVCNRTAGMGAGIAAKLAYEYIGAPTIYFADAKIREMKLFDDANLIVVPDGVIANIYAMINPGAPYELGDSFDERLSRLIDGLFFLEEGKYLFPIGIPLVLSGLGRDISFGQELTDLEYFKTYVVPHIEHFDLNVYYL